MRAVLAGTFERPVVELCFDRDSRHPGTGQSLIDWVKALPGRRWDPDADSGRGAWLVYALGANGEQRLAEAGFCDGDGWLVLLGPDGNLTDLGQYAKPLVAIADWGSAVVHPRLLGYEAVKRMLPPSAIWQPGKNHWIVPAADMASERAASGLRAGFTYADGTAEAVRDAARIDKHARTAPSAKPGPLSDAATLAAATDAANTGGAAERVIAAVGDVPEWFGLALDPYQRAGAVAVAAGHRLLADAPGLGKTRTALAAAAILRSRRTVVLCPPVVVTHWAREIAQSGLADHDWDGDGNGDGDSSASGGLASDRAAEAGVSLAPPTSHGTPSHASPPQRRRGREQRPGPDAHIVPDKTPLGEVVVFRAGRKEPTPPEQGVVVVPDTLLAARPALLERLRQWRPDVLVYDEVHRAKTWSSARAEAARSLAEASGTGIAASGTPMFANPVEMASALEIAGHLGPTFGGFAGFTARYAKRNKFNAWVPVKAMLPELRVKLNASVWVQRVKADVLADLPPKSRRALVVDVDARAYAAAHAEVAAAVDEWIEQSGVAAMPDERRRAAITQWARDQIGMVTMLRRAAGLAKVPVATEMIADWVQANPADDAGAYSRPLIVWTHHREVSQAMADAVLAALPKGRVGVIIGGTPADQRAATVDAFQRGELPVIICSIHAAGVGITLTRSSDVYFIETDWTPALVSQAEDRAHRRGQNDHVLVTTLIAPNTLDERIQATLKRKAEILDAVMRGGDNDVAVIEDADEMTDAAQILAEIVAERLDHLASRRSRPAASRPARRSVA